MRSQYESHLYTHRGEWSSQQNPLRFHNLHWEHVQYIFGYHIYTPRKLSHWSFLKFHMFDPQKTLLAAPSCCFKQGGGRKNESTQLRRSGRYSSFLSWSKLVDPTVERCKGKRSSPWFFLVFEMSEFRRMCFLLRCFRTSQEINMLFDDFDQFGSLRHNGQRFNYLFWNPLYISWTPTFGPITKTYHEFNYLRHIKSI